MSYFDDECDEYEAEQDRWESDFTATNEQVNGA